MGVSTHMVMLSIHIVEQILEYLLSLYADSVDV